MLDYENLPFTASRTPYVELLQPTDAARGPDAPGDDVQYAVYGWSRTPLYSSHETAWPLDDAVFALRRAVARSGLGARCSAERRAVRRLPA